MILQIKNKISKEYHPLVDDLLKYSTILFVVNILMFASNPSKHTLLGGVYLKLMIYILLE